MLLGIVMQRWRLAEWGLLPWIVVSQTVPLIAFAPVVNAIGTQIARGGPPWPQWLSVAIIASYLAFFPVAVGALRGLAAPDRIHLDLMRTYAAGYWPTLLRLRLPAAVPYLLPALRLAAANAVVGAVVAEVSIGMRGGIGRMLIQLAGQDRATRPLRGARPSARSRSGSSPPGPSRSSGSWLAQLPQRRSDRMTTHGAPRGLAVRATGVGKIFPTKGGEVVALDRRRPARSPPASSSRSSDRRDAASRPSCA